LGGLATRACCEIEYQEFLFTDLRISEYIDWMGCCELLYIKIPNQVIQRKSQASLKRIKILTAIHRVYALYMRGGEDPTIGLKVLLYLLLHPNLDTYGARDRLLDRREKFLKFSLFSLEEGLTEVCDEAVVDHNKYSKI
jgi:hypothetical protein